MGKVGPWTVSGIGCFVGGAVEREGRGGEEEEKEGVVNDRAVCACGVSLKGREGRGEAERGRSGRRESGKVGKNVERVVGMGEEGSGEIGSRNCG